MTVTAGLDVGGAHLKVALAEDNRIIAVEQIPCPLWQGFDKLDAALIAAQPLVQRADRRAVTMTGELSDLFSDRKSGVERLVERLSAELGPEARFWMGQRGFGPASDAIAFVDDVASTNFLATAELVARRVKDALLIDMGSTTTDIIPVGQGRVLAQGLTDADRLATGELVYTGLSRTAVMAVANAATLKGRPQGLSREYFATMADVRRILGELPEGVDQHATADGRGKSLGESVARFARMFGCDAADAGLDEWMLAARAISDAQQRSIIDGCRQVLAASSIPDNARVVAAGIGADVVAAIAKGAGRQSVSFGEMAGASDGNVLGATRCAPAAALALLLAEAS